jgi:hypothetical protein
VYPAFKPEMGHKGGHAEFALHGMDVWGSDVDEFLREADAG